MQRVVLHAPELDRADQALRNARNLFDDLPGEVEVALVLNGDAVEAATPASPHAPFMREQMARGLAVLACGRSLRKHGLEGAPLVEGVVVVPGGVTEAVRLQAGGYAYLRP